MLRLKQILAGLILVAVIAIVSYTPPSLSTKAALDQLGGGTTNGNVPAFWQAAHFWAIPVAFVVLAGLFAPDVARWLRGGNARQSE